MTAEHAGVGRGLWLQWVLASAVGGVIGVTLFGSVSAAVSSGISTAVFGVLGEAASVIVGEGVFGGVALGGILGGIGIVQWLVLRRYASWAGSLALASTLGGLVGGTVGFATFGALSVFGRGELGGVAGVILGLVVFGIAQWVVLKGDIPRAGWWVMASAVGVAVASPLSGSVGASLSVGGGVYGAVYGAITGIALRRLLHS